MTTEMKIYRRTFFFSFFALVSVVQFEFQPSGCVQISYKFLFILFIILKPKISYMYDNYRTVGNAGSSYVPNSYRDPEPKNFLKLRLQLRSWLTSYGQNSSSRDVPAILLSSLRFSFAIFILKRNVKKIIIIIKSHRKKKYKFILNHS